MSQISLTNMEYPMINIQGGVVELRDDRTKRVWTVEIKPFLLAQFPVTRQLYHTVLESFDHTYDSGREPVVHVSWFDAIKFCNQLSDMSGLDRYYSIGDRDEDIICNGHHNGFRLPTEAEWQYACKAGNKAYQYGRIDHIAWYNGNSEGHVHKVGLKEPNAWGLHDMLGNVWEWCWDLYDEMDYGNYRIFRGGSWAEEERGCGATCRRRSHPTFRIDDLGFRLARSN